MSQFPDAASRIRPRDLCILLAICLLALLSRAIPFARIQDPEPARALRPDSASYLGPAEALRLHGVFAAGPRASDPPEIIRTPGYPAFLAAARFATGGGTREALLLQILASLGAIALGWLMAFDLWRDPRAAHLAALLIALDPLGWLYSQLILSDMLFAVLFALHCWTVLRLLRSENHGAAWALAAGSALVAATFVRPVGYYWIVPLSLGLFWAFRRTPRRAALSVACLLAVWAPPILGWQARNGRVAGNPEFSAIQSYNLLAYRAAGVVALRDGLSLDAASLRLTSLAALQSLPRDAGYDGRFYAACRRNATQILLAHPALALRTQIAGAGRILFGPGAAGLSEYLGHPSRIGRTYSLLYVVALWALFCTAFICPLCRGASALSVEGALLLGAIGYIVFVSAGPEAYSRFRLPLVPLLAALAGGAALRRPPIKQT